MTSDPLNQIELISTLSVPRYAPRLKPTPIPGANWNDTPLFCLKLNDEWVSHVLGVLTALDQPDTWLGTAEQIYAARQQVNEIMVAFMTACEDCAIQFRIEDCELQWRESEADEWISLGNVCGADGVDGSDGEPGPPGADGEDGAPGAPGAPGADGADCDCADYTHVPTPDNPPDTSDNETACNIAGGLTSYLRTKQAQAIEAGRSTVELVIAIEGLAAAIAAAIFTGGAAWPLIVAAAAVLMNVLIAADGAETDAMMADDAFWQAMSCSIYCALKPDKDITEAKQAEIAAAIRATDYTSGSYDAPFFYGTTADFFGALPNEVIRKSVTVGAMISYDCSECDCPENHCNNNWVSNEPDIPYTTLTWLDDVTLQASVVPYDGTHSALTIFTSDGLGCRIEQINDISGTIPDHAAILVCETPDDNGRDSNDFSNYVANGLGHPCVNGIAFLSTGPFTVEFTLVTCEE